MHKFRKL